MTKKDAQNALEILHGFYSRQQSRQKYGERHILIPKQTRPPTREYAVGNYYLDLILVQLEMTKLSILLTRSPCLCTKTRTPASQSQPV